jgi:hypothetical protein
VGLPEGDAEGAGLGATLGAGLGATLGAGVTDGCGCTDGAGGNDQDGAAAVVHAATVAAVAPMPASAETLRKPRRLSADVESEGVGASGSAAGFVGMGSRWSVVLMTAHDAGRSPVARETHSPIRI